MWEQPAASSRRDRGGLKAPLQRRNHLRPRATVIALVVLALVSAACGARWDDDQKAVVEARDALSLTAFADGWFTGSPDDSAPRTANSEADRPQTTTPTNDTAAVGTAGSVDPAAGEHHLAAETGAGGQPGEVPCTAPSDEVGVSDTTMRVGSISTLSGPVPGFGESSAAATMAYVTYVNATGGICGRQVELVAADDGQDYGRYRSILRDMAPQVFGLVGGFAGGEPGGHEVAANTGIPIVTTPADDNFYDVPNVFGMNPGFPDPVATAHKYHWLVSEGITKAAIVYPAADQAQLEVNRKHKPQLTGAGIQIVLEKVLPLSTLNFDAAAADVNRSGAQYMLFVGETGMNTGMARSMARYDIEHPDYLTGYSQEFIDLAGGAAEGSTAWIRSLPFEEAGSNAELDTFLEWMSRAAPGITPDYFAASAWAASKAFFDTLQSLPGPITRQSFIQTIRQLTAYDAGGFIGTINVGQKASNGCFIGLRVENRRWVRMVPSSGFLC